MCVKQPSAPVSILGNRLSVAVHPHSQTVAAEVCLLCALAGLTLAVHSRLLGAVSVQDSNLQEPSQAPVWRINTLVAVASLAGMAG